MKTWKSKKPSKTFNFFKVFGGLGGPSGAIWRPCWAVSAHLGDKLAYAGPTWRYVVPSRRQDATSKRQDDAKMAPRAPRGANLSEKGSQHKPDSTRNGKRRFKRNCIRCVSKVGLLCCFVYTLFILLACVRACVRVCVCVRLFVSFCLSFSLSLRYEEIVM